MLKFKDAQSETDHRKATKRMFFVRHWLVFQPPKQWKNTKLGKTTPKLKGIPLEQAQIYGQYGIESVGLKKRLKSSTQKKLPLKTEIWCLVKRWARYFFFGGGKRNQWKMELFCKTLRTRKFWTGKFFGASTHGILTHSGFRICIWKVGTTNFWPCFGRPKLGECDKMGSVSKIMSR